MPTLDQKNAKAFWGWSVFLFFILVAADQLSKKYAPDIFNNNNFAFSLPLPVWLMYIIYAAVLIGIVYYCAKNYRSFGFMSGAAWVLIFAGALSNIGERIILGYVRDFIYISMNNWTGIYNLADGYIIAGVLILLLNTKSESRNSKSG